MVPEKSHPLYRKLVTGESTYAFQTFSANMCISNNQRKVRAAAGDPAVIEEAVADLHAFFVKFESVFGDELKKIFG